MSELAKYAPTEALHGKRPVVIFSSNWDGLGHTTRDISIIGKLVGRGVPTISCSQNGVAGFIQSNFPGISPDLLGIVDLKDTSRTNGYDAGTFVTCNPRAREPLRYAGVVLTDFIPEVRKVSQQEGNNAKVVGVYHSLDDISAPPELVEWQEDMLELAKPLDLLFHMTMTRPPKKDGLEIVSINPIAREVTRSPEEVKASLGLKTDEEFVLIAGGLSGHPKLMDFLTGAKAREDGVRYVAQIGSNASVLDDLPEHIIWINAQPDGHNYINAAAGVVTKPGFGTIIECVKTDTPVLLSPHEHPEGQTNLQLMGTLLEGLPLELDLARDPQEQITELLDAKDAIATRLRDIPCDGADAIADYLIEARSSQIAQTA